MRITLYQSTDMTPVYNHNIVAIDVDLGVSVWSIWANDLNEYRYMGSFRAPTTGYDSWSGVITALEIYDYTGTLLRRTDQGSVSLPEMLRLENLDRTAPGSSAAYLLRGRDTIIGSAGDDVLLAYAGNDIITGGAGDDSIDGGAGIDTLRLSAAASRYRVLEHTISSVILAGPDGTDTLTGIERIQFAAAAPISLSAWLAGSKARPLYTQPDTASLAATL